MSLGTWSLTAYSQPLTLIVAIEAVEAFHLLPSEAMTLERVRWWLVVIGLLPAFGSVAYKGVLFSTCAQPGWKDARSLGAWMANSALMLGSAQMLAMSILTGHAKAAAALRIVTAVLLLLNLVPTFVVFLEIRATLARIYRDQQIYLGLVQIVVGGTLVPVILLLAGGGALWSLGAVLLILTGSLAVRMLFLTIPHASHNRQPKGAT
jgi:hypothetical protein